MNVKEEFLKFKNWLIEHKDDYRDIIANKPYCIETKTDTVFNKDLVLFKYSQIDSDFGNPFVKLCRGLVLESNTFDPVVFPFVKFHNAGEIYADDIYWKSCWVTEKLDGSIIKIVKIGSNDILIGTNSNIDAFKAPITEQIGCKAKSFGELALEGLAYYGLNQEMLATMLDYNKTYMFELTSPFNKVVVTWHETKLNFLGVRDNTTFQETYFCDHELADVFNTPKVFPLHSLQECIDAATTLGPNDEGYVVCDKNFNRVKVKSVLYCSLHHMKNNGVLSYERGIDIVRGNELGEVLTYFPEFKEHLEDIKTKYDNYVAYLKKGIEDLNAWLKSNGYDKQPWFVQSGGQKRKDLAMFVMSTMKDVSGFAFSYVDGKVESAEKWLAEMPAKNLCKALGYKE